MADCHATTIPPATKGHPPWTAPPAENGCESVPTCFRAFPSPATSASILIARAVIPLRAKSCPNCGRTMSERPVTDKDGRIVGTQYKCENPKCKRK